MKTPQEIDTAVDSLDRCTCTDDSICEACCECCREPLAECDCRFGDMFAYGRDAYWQSTAGCQIHGRRF